MTVGKICSRTTYLADVDESVQKAATRMEKENVGTLLVVDRERRVTGILTDRDVALRTVAAGRDAGTTKVETVMTAHPRTVDENAPIESAVAAMRSLGVRRMPVVDAERRLVGIVSIDDVLELITEELTDLGRVVGASRTGHHALTSST